MVASQAHDWRRLVAVGVVELFAVEPGVAKVETTSPRWKKSCGARDRPRWRAPGQPGGSFTLKMVNGPERGRSFLNATSFKCESLM